MKIARTLSLALVATVSMLGACTGDDSGNAAGGGDAGGGSDGSSHVDGSSGGDSGGGGDSSSGGDSAANDSGGGDSSSNNDSGGGTDASDGGDGEAGPVVVNGCTVFEDHTAVGDARAIAFGGANGLKYVPSCMEIKVGQTVTWNGDFATHPLQAFNGDTPNPIVAPDAGATTDPIAFPTAGTFGFHCGVHANMVGAIKVIP
jgi:plastocyanin